MREFKTAAKEKVQAETHGEQSGRLTFSVDGVECHANMPTPGQMALVIAMISRHMPELERIAGAIEFFNGVLEPGSRDHLIGRLMDPEDDFEAQEVMDLMIYFVEEWSGRPTEGPRGSARSRSTGGRKSTQRTPA